MTRDLQRNYQSSRSKKKNHRNHYTAVILSSYTCDTHSSTAERQKDDTTSLRRRKRKGTAVVIFLPPVYTSSFTILPRRRDKSAAPHIEESRERESKVREKRTRINGREVITRRSEDDPSYRVFRLRPSRPVFSASSLAQRVARGHFRSPFVSIGFPTVGDRNPRVD